MASRRWDACVFSSSGLLPGTRPGQELVDAVDGVIGTGGLAYGVTKLPEQSRLVGRSDHE